jgi:hypothetical protein
MSETLSSDQERSELVTICCGASGLGAAPPQEISNKEAQTILINKITILNMARNLADKNWRINSRIHLPKKTPPRDLSPPFEA